MTAENERELQALLGHLRDSVGFTLLLGWVPDERTSRAIIESLRERLPSPPAVIDLREWPAETLLLDWLLARATEAGCTPKQHDTPAQRSLDQSGVIVLTGLAGVDIRRHPLRQLNTHRNYWMSAAPCRWVLFLPPYEQLRAAAKTADEPPFSLGDECPDVYSIRSGDVVFAAEPPDPDEHAESMRPEPRRRLDDLEKTLAYLEGLQLGGDPAALILYARTALGELEPWVAEPILPLRNRVEVLLERLSISDLPPVLAARVGAARAAFHGTQDLPASCELVQNAIHLLQEALNVEALTAVDLRDAIDAVATLMRSSVLARRAIADVERLLLGLVVRSGAEELSGEVYFWLAKLEEARREFAAAEALYRKSLEITERLRDEKNSAIVYNQLGIVAAELGNLELAEQWWQKSLDIKERLGDEGIATSTYHNLGRLAAGRGNWEVAERWYRKSLAAEERLGDENRASATYHQLGIVNAKRGNREAAEHWYRKSLAIKERLGNDSGAALTYGQLGLLAKDKGEFDECGAWLRKAGEIFVRKGDSRRAAQTMQNYSWLLRIAPTDLQPRLKAEWEAAGLGPLPEDEKEADAAD